MKWKFTIVHTIERRRRKCLPFQRFQFHSQLSPAEENRMRKFTAKLRLSEPNFPLSVKVSAKKKRNNRKAPGSRNKHLFQLIRYNLINSFNWDLACLKMALS